MAELGRSAEEHMKKYLLVLLLVAVSSARAGMPDVEMEEALVEKIEKTPAGWVVFISGPMLVPIITSNNPESGALATLYADKARVMVPVGNQLYSLSLSGADSYEKRLHSMVGKKTSIQMWGATLTLEAGRVVQIVAGDVSLLRPNKGEAAFDLGRLPEIGRR